MGTHGDVYDRLFVRVEEMKQSVRIVEQALEALPGGPIMAEGMKRILRVPAGEVYMRVESPRGEYGVYLVSNGSDKPYRHKVRGASFCQPLGAAGDVRWATTWRTWSPSSARSTSCCARWTGDPRTDPGQRLGGRV